MTARELLLALPEKFNSEAAADKPETTFHFKISGDGGGDFTAHLKDGKCEVQEGLTGEAKCVVSATNEVFTNIISGKQNPQMAVMMGKLKISNLGEMMKYAKLFGLMK